MLNKYQFGKDAVHIALSNILNELNDKKLVHWVSSKINYFNECMNYFQEIDNSVGGDGKIITFLNSFKKTYLQDFDFNYKRMSCGVPEYVYTHTRCCIFASYRNVLRKIENNSKSRARLNNQEVVHLIDDYYPNLGNPFHISTYNRCFKILRVDIPKVGELYLNPTGKKSEFTILSCKNNYHKKLKHIIEEIDE